MPAANHAFYLRNCYLTNKLSRGEMEIAGTTLDLRKVKVPIYNLATREDHIAPAKSVLFGSQYFGGPVTFVLAGSGHIAGVVNPPGKPKYQYWTGSEPMRLRRRQMAGKRRGASRLVVAELARLDQGARQQNGAGARDRRRQAQADRGRARFLCEDQELGVRHGPLLIALFSEKTDL